MLEIPESKTIGTQADSVLKGKIITSVFTPKSLHKYAFFNGDPSEYHGILTGREILAAKGHGMFVDICFDENVFLTIGDGTNMRYHPPSAQPPESYQLLLTFDDESFISLNVAMYGGIWAYKGHLDNKYHERSLHSISPLDDDFNESFFRKLLLNESKDLSAKALLATEQRIPGLGNGVLQDILFNAGIHPRRKKSGYSGPELIKLFQSLKQTLKRMTDLGGRDTEKDLFGQYGKYKTLLSKNTVNQSCPVCGTPIRKEAYLGGAIYYCPSCQKL